MSGIKLKRDPDFNIIQDSYQERAYRAAYDNGNMIYEAFAVPGAAEDDRVWQIKLLTYTGSDVTAITWPELDSKASTDYSFSWTDRATYTYS